MAGARVTREERNLAVLKRRPRRPALRSDDRSADFDLAQGSGTPRDRRAGGSCRHRPDGSGIARCPIPGTALSIVFGKLGDLFGHRRVPATGVAASSLSCLLCAFAPTYDFLIGFRFLQGISQGLSLSCIVALMTLNVAPEPKRGDVGAPATVVGVGMAAGPILGGVLVDWFGWLSVFCSRATFASVILLFLGRVAAPDGPVLCRRQSG